MKTINTYINEKLRLTNKRTYTRQPKDKTELQFIIIHRIKNEGNECDLNDIDTSKITDMKYLFDTRDYKIFKKFNGDISMWDVSNVVDMTGMFYGCENFNGDVSKWNVSNVEYINCMFEKCKKFNCDLSKWDVSNVMNMYKAFDRCEEFNQNLDSWDVSKVKYMAYAFYDCPTTPNWYDENKYE